MDANRLLVSLLVSAVGFVLFSYGKRQTRMPHLVVGLILLVYSYFLSSVAVTLAIAAALIALLWIAVRFGW